MLQSNRRIAFCLVALSFLGFRGWLEAAEPGPFDRQLTENLAKLRSDSPADRAAAAEALGFLRAYRAEQQLIGALNDDAAEVRRQSAMALAWCGGRASIEPLLGALNDDDWVVRQAAHVSLNNLTGMEFAFEATAPPATRNEQLRSWQTWWAAIPADRPPPEVLALLEGGKNLAGGRRVTASTTYRGPADVLVDGEIGPAYWQTKFVEPPQWVCVDLGQKMEFGRVVVHQYSDKFVMNGYELAVSLDNRTFDVVARHDGKTPVELVVEFPERQARYVRITSFGSVNPTYPSTLFEIEVGDAPRRPDGRIDSIAWRLERGVRALGVLGGQGATEAILEVLGDAPPTRPALRPMVRSGIRSLGRLRDEAGFQALIGLLDDTMWARNAADALGEFGDPRAVPPLLAAYERYSKDLKGNNPPDVPPDDVMTFPSEDRMLETPYAIAYALCRLPVDQPADKAELRRLGPRIMANLPGDHDTFFLYEPEVGHLLTRHLIEQTGLRQEACEVAMLQLGQPRRVPAPEEPIEWSAFPPYRIASWLPAVCTKREEVPRLLSLLDHEEGWVRLNAAKTLAWIGDKSAIEPIAAILRNTPPEAAFGYNGTFKNEEYDDPAPRWREGLLRALGLLGAHEHTGLIVRILNDENSVAEVRHAAAEALGDLDNDEALAALNRAAADHSVFCVRHIARDALRCRGLLLPVLPDEPQSCDERQPAPENIEGLADVEAIVFIQGSNNIPNTLGTVEQADRWRETYVVTDSGPAYRPGSNLFTLQPPAPDGKVTPLTCFEDGYVAEPEISWDGKQVIFTRRGQDDPWWQLYRINVDGTGLTRLTDGPYHHVGPNFLPDGRIIFATSRSGIRDEYHGYPCTVLCIMNPDGSAIQPIATNIGRDNEPALLHDGRIVFSRLEVFYSRNKTELTLHAMHTDGTQDVVLYGPERRQYWRDLDHGPKSPADGQEAPLTHRVLRMTQPQPMPDGRHIVVSTQGGLVLIGSKRTEERHITPDFKEWAYTTPFPLPDGTLLCAATLRVEEREEVDLGLYLFDPATGRRQLIYNDPALADFEARPIMAGRPPQLQPSTKSNSPYAGRFLCSSVFATQEPEVLERGRFVRLIEGVPVIARHSTHTNPWEVWKNHGGTFARVLGTAPLAADGSFYVEVPADRLMHFQVLDSDRRVVGNQLTWIYPRPGETKSCVGCHENPHTTVRGNDPLASHYAPIDFLPDGNEFTYRAKAWFKGSLPPEIEERTRTVRAVNLLGR
jgi:HEAT repeat protein